jgi:hypothetical protein
MKTQLNIRAKRLLSQKKVLEGIEHFSKKTNGQKTKVNFRSSV